MVNLSVETKESCYEAMLAPLPNAKHVDVDFEKQKVLINGEDVF